MRSCSLQRQGESFGPHSLKYLFIIALLLNLIAFPHPASGQDSPITVSVNNTQFSTDDLVILTVTVVDNSPQQPRPVLPPLDGLSVVDFDIATNVSTIQGQIYTEVIYTYELQPRRTGSLTIPSIPVKIDEQIFRAPPISIMVSQGAAPAPSPGNAVTPYNIEPPAGLESQDFFVEAIIDVQEPYLGQQLTYIFRFYQAIQLYRQPQFEMPIFNGFETIGLPVQEYNLDIAERTYLITELRTALFPKTTGSINIGPARLMFPGNFFEEPLELYTDPITVEVKSLPANAPPGFNGAVGQYTIEAWFSPQVAIVNQPSTYSVAVSGVGNIHTLPQPVWPPLNEWRTYDSVTSLTTDMKDGKMSGTRVFERLMISNQLGDLTISPATLVYFDPTADEYRTISTQPLSVRVLPAPTPDPAAATAIAAQPVPTGTPVSALNSFSTPVASDSSTVNPALPDSLVTNWRFALPVGLILLWTICGAIPVAAALGAGGVWLWQKRQQQAQQETEALKSPKQKTHPALTAALAENDNNYKVVGQALNDYLSKLLGVSTRGSTRTELMYRLEERGIDTTQINRINAYLAQSEMGRYGPKTEDAGWELLSKTDELLFELDKLYLEQTIRQS